MKNKIYIFYFLYIVYLFNRLIKISAVRIKKPVFRFSYVNIIQKIIILLTNFGKSSVIV